MISAGEALIRACNLANDYHAQNMSPLALIAESGFRDHRSAIDVEKIKKHVAENPRLISDWMGYSENKRVSSGWYFSADSFDGPYVVGYFPAKDRSRKEKKYSDGIEACAIYIMHELDAIAS